MNGPDLDVFVIGSCMTDLICYCPRLPKPGETISGTKFSIGFGGKGANQCIAAAKLGASCALLAKLGNDSFGKNYVNNLKEYGINLLHLSVSNEDDSGVAQICVANNGENSIIIIPGANNKVNCVDVDNAETIISCSKVIVFQFEIPLNVTLHALKLCKQYKCVTIVNAAPACDNIDPDMFSLCDIFCVNEMEAEAITGIQIISIANCFESVLKLRSLGCKLSIVTLGSRGVVFLSSGENDVPIHVSVETVTKPVDTTGAGDSFLGTLAFLLAKCPNLSMKEVIQYSCNVARLSVMNTGTQSSFPCKDDADIRKIFKPLRLA